MPTKPATVTEYLAALPDDRRKALQAVRKVIRANLGKGYKEGIQYGMIGYGTIPHSIYPSGLPLRPQAAGSVRWGSPRRRTTCRST